MVASTSVQDWLYPEINNYSSDPPTVVERITVSLCDLEHNQLFVYRDSLYYLMETPGTIMKANDLDGMILERVKLPAMRIAMYTQQTGGSYQWIGCSKPCVEQFWATSEVVVFTYNPRCIR